jgi:hypothetical protein
MGCHNSISAKYVYGRWDLCLQTFRRSGGFENFIKIVLWSRNSPRSRLIIARAWRSRRPSDGRVADHADSRVNFNVRLRSSRVYE